MERHKSNKSKGGKNFYLCGVLILVLMLSLSLLYSRLKKFRGHARDVVAVVVKDEPDILPLWLAWHIAIFGISNIVVVDQESSNPAALRLLKEFERAGGAVMWGIKDYSKKGEHTMAALNYLRSLNPGLPIRLFFPLDVDEFVIAAKNRGNNGTHPSDLFFRAADVRCAIANIFPSQFLGFSYYPYYISSLVTSINDTLATASYYANGFMGSNMKKFFMSDFLQGLDHGNHLGVISGGPFEYESIPTLRLLHLHSYDPRAIVQKAKNDLYGFNYHRAMQPCSQFDAKLCFTGPPVPENELVEHLQRIPANFPGMHKVNKFLAFMEGGLKALVSPLSEVQFSLPPLPTLLKDWAEPLKRPCIGRPD